jgi:hypothetical protein
MIQLPPYEIEGAEQQPVYDYTVTLSDTEYRIVLVYRERGDRWYMTIYDADDTVLLAGKKLSVNTPLLEIYEIDGLPPGDVVCWDSSGAEAECGYEDLGKRCLLLYLEPADVPTSTSSNDNITIEAVP